MNAHLAELFQRFVTGLAGRAESPLRAAQLQAADSPSAKQQPLHTVLIHGRREGAEEPLAVILMTVPSLSPGDPKILEFAARRARAHKAPYFVTWTLRDAILWRTPKPGVPASRDAMDAIKNYSDLYEISATDKDALTEPVKLKVLDRGKEILHDLERLLADEALELVQIDATYFVGRLLDAVHMLLPVVSESLQHRLETETEFRDALTVWAMKHSIAGLSSDPEFARSIARQIIYRLLGKILFYQSLRRSARQLPRLDFKDVDSAQVLPTLRRAFGEALKIDYHAVFEEQPPVDMMQWPARATVALAKLIGDLNDRDFAHLSQDVVGTVFERLIPPEERHGLGQYFTSENLCDFVAAFCIRTPTDTVFDPTCGTGTFLIRSYDRLRWLGNLDHAALLSQIWGVDIAPFPAELATINLFRQRIAEHGNFPRIICADFLKLSPGDRFPFPPPKMDLEHPESIEEPVPAFDAIVGNFPYVSADQIEKHDPEYREFLRTRLLDGWFDAYPELFYYTNKKQQAAFEQMIAAGSHAGCERTKIQHRISTYADLYVHLFFHAARFLKPGGRIGIVTSNAWLDVNYGHELQRFFLRYFKIVAILESRCEPWFTEASVNTVVTVLERCDCEKERDAHLVKFVKVKKSLAELLPGDPFLAGPARWKHLSSLTAQIERAGRKYSKTHPLGMVTEENDEFRTRILRQGEMRFEVEREQKTIKWGRYLRAPQVFFDMIACGRFCLLRELATPRFGSKTRINDFFHVSAATVQQFGIEADYLFPLLKSPKHSATITVNMSELALRLFVCRQSKVDLRRLGHLGTLRYIEWGEKQVYDRGEFKGLKWPEGAWVKGRLPGWYALPNTEVNFGQLFFSEAFGDRHVQWYSPERLVPDKRLYFLLPVDGTSTPDLAAVLNASLTSLSVEVFGRVTMGDGVLEFSVEDARDYLLVPNTRGVSTRTKKEIRRRFNELLPRPIETTFDEIKKADRQALDAAVLAAVGLDPGKFLKPLYDGLCELVRERVSLGQMRGKARKTKVRGDRAEKRIAEEVLDEVVPQGPKRFPDEFLSAAAAKHPKITIQLPAEPLIFENRGLFRGVHTVGSKFEREVKTPAEGKFLVYAQRAGHTEANLPSQAVEVSRTVANYEQYLKDLRIQLYDTYYRRSLDTRTAARLTQAAFDRFRLPTPEASS